MEKEPLIRCQAGETETPGVTKEKRAVRLDRAMDTMR